MYDYIRRFLIVIAVALSIGLLFIGATVSFAAAEEKYELVNYIWPTEGLITDTFGTRGGKHYGIDIAAPRGTPVVSVSDGVVSKSYYSSTYGHVIFIEHQDGFEAVYAHLNDRLVHQGDIVTQGDKIGSVGNTGRSSGAHLHFEVHDGNWLMTKSNAIDPFLVLDDEIENDYQVAFSSKIIEERENKKLNSIEGNYVVQQGDTLWKISEQSGVPVSKIKKLNGLKNDFIQAGIVLKVEN